MQHGTSHRGRIPCQSHPNRSWLRVRIVSFLLRWVPSRYQYNEQIECLTNFLKFTLGEIRSGCRFLRHFYRRWWTFSIVRLPTKQEPDRLSYSAVFCFFSQKIRRDRPSPPLLVRTLVPCPVCVVAYEKLYYPCVRVRQYDRNNITFIDLAWRYTIWILPALYLDFIST